MCVYIHITYKYSIEHMPISYIMRIKRYTVIIKANLFDFYHASNEEIIAKFIYLHLKCHQYPTE